MKNIIVNIEVIQIDIENNSEKIEFATEAKLYKKENAYYISYKESEITGMDGTSTTIKIYDGNINIIRFGSIESNLKFIHNKEYTCDYKTPYGIFPMTIITKTINIRADQNFGEILLEYDIKINDEKLNSNIFKLNYK